MPNHVSNIIVINAEPNRIKEILEAIQNDEEGIGSIDFSKLRPMPESLNIESGSMTKNCIHLYLTAINPLIDYFGKDNKVRGNEFVRIVNVFNNNQGFTPYKGNLSPEDVKIKSEHLLKYSADEFKSVDDIFVYAKKVLNNIEQHGHKDWYDWSCANWGTKWNAYSFGDFKDGENTITFKTAWTAPQPILELLTEKFPDAEFYHLWADDDIGQNVGKRVYLDGEMTDCDIPKAHSVEAYEMAAEIKGECLEDRGLYKSDDGQTYEYREEDEYEEAEV